MSKSVTQSHFGGAYYDESSHILVRGTGEKLELRPQSLQVFLYLAKNEGRLVSKDELIQTIWKDVSVTDDSLVQCIADIRRALGDKQHAILQTKPRRGYTLIADSPLMPISDHNNNKTFPRTPILLVVLVVLITGLGFLTISPTEKLDAPPGISLKISTPTALSIQDKQLENETRVALSRYKTIRLVDSGSADFDLLLKPQASAEGSPQQFTLELKDNSDDSLFFAESFSLNSNNLSNRHIASRIAAAVASPGGGAVGRHLLDRARNKPVDELTHFECYAYGYGWQACSNNGDANRAQACVDRILEKNPRDARALALQAAILTQRRWFYVGMDEKQRNDPALQKSLQAEAAEVARQAEALADGDDSAIYWGIAQAYVASCQPEKLKATVERGLEINPDDPMLLGSFGNWLAYAGFWDEGVHLSERALELEPRHYEKWWWFATAKRHFIRGEHEAALEAFMKSFSDSNWLSHLHLAYTLPYLGREDDAEFEAALADGLSPGLTREKAISFYQNFCFSDDYIEKVEQGMIRAGIPSAND